MPKNIVTFGIISKRVAAKNSVSKNLINEANSIEKEYKFVNSKLDNLDESTINIIKSKTDKIFESLADSNTANKFKFYPLSIISKLNNSNNRICIEYANQLADKYCSRVLPYISEINYVVECISDFALSDKQKEKILKESGTYLACDRIVNNYNTISKRFNLEETILKNKGNIKLATESICSMIDTYNREAFQKMNICIEEMFYIIEKNNIPCNKSDVINTIVEYFLLSSPELSDRNLNGFKKCVAESCFISEDDMSNVKYLFNNRDLSKEETSHIKGFIEYYFISCLKTKETFEETVINCISSDILDLSYNFRDILEFIATVYKSDNLISDTDLELVMEDIDTKISSRIISLVNDAEISRDIFSNFLECIINVVNENKVLVTTYPRLHNFITHIKNITEAIYPYMDFLYDKYNIQVISNFESCNIEIPIKEGHIFRGHNLLVAIRNLDKYLGAKCKDFTNKLFGKKKKASDKPSLRERISNFLFTDEDKWLSKKLKQGAKNFNNASDVLSMAFEAVHNLDVSSINPYSYISEESHTFDMTLASIHYDDSDEDVQDSMSDICKEFNHILESNNLDSFKLYYMINANEVSLHLVENHKFIFEDDTITKINEANHPDLDHAIELLSEAEVTADFIDSINNKDIETSLFSYFSSDKNMSINKFDTILEALSLLGIDESIVDKFANKYSDHIYYTITEDTESDEAQSRVDELMKNYVPQMDVPSDIQLEAYLALDALLESDKDEDEEYDDYEPEESSGEDEKKLSPEEKEEVKKNPYKGINLKSIKLALLGLKKKFSNMSQKEKELSKNVDSAFKRLVQSFKNALVSDSREAIIKGSVIPSFSKCLKIGIPAAIGISKGIINPGVAAIVALGSFALSKHITKKERILLLDQIETELEVVEKEIQIAEREENMKKYKALLQYKKNLQRQYQRIRYNVKIGKNLLPGSNTGVSGSGDNGY